MGAARASVNGALGGRAFLNSDAASPAPIMMLDGVIFDMDDVLCRYDLEARIAHLARLSGKSPVAIRAALWDSGFADEADAGGACKLASVYFSAFQSRLGAPIAPEDWLAARRDAMTPWPGMLALVSRLKSQGVVVGLLTNNDAMVAEHLEDLLPGVTACFGASALFVSARLGLRKPDPEIYRRVCACLNIAPERALFVDDMAVNVAGAVAAGLEGHVFAGSAGLRAHLLAAGVSL